MANRNSSGSNNVKFADQEVLEQQATEAKKPRKYGEDWHRFKISTLITFGLQSLVVDENTGFEATELEIKRFDEVCRSLAYFDKECLSYYNNSLRFLTAGKTEFARESNTGISNTLSPLPVQKSIERILVEYVKNPISVLNRHVLEIRQMIKDRGVFMLDYIHYISKLRRIESKYAESNDSTETKVDKVKDRLKGNQQKKQRSANQLRQKSKQVSASIEALEYALTKQKIIMCEVVIAVSRIVSEKVVKSLEGVTVPTSSSNTGQDLITTITKKVNEVQVKLESGAADVAGVIAGLPSIDLVEVPAYEQAYQYCMNTSGGAFGKPIELFDRVPSAFLKLIAFVERKGLFTKGLFQTAGNEKRMSKIKNMLNSSPNTDLQATFGESSEVVIDVSQLLARFLLMMPHPLIPRSVYAESLDIAEDFVTSGSPRKGSAKINVFVKRVKKILIIICQYSKR